MKQIYVLFILIAVTACKDSDSLPKSYTYFGGEIVNPNDDYVFLYKDDQFIDSVKLDKDNRFLMKLESIEDGLYNFRHKPEFQYVVLEETDSVLLRLNTLDFDESLVFSGNGDIKNNFLIDMYLVNEDEEEIIYDYYGLEPETFSRHLDSLRDMKLEQYNSMIDNNQLSPIAAKLTKAAIDFTYYTKKEIYPYSHKRKKKVDCFVELPDDFYDYRNSVNMNDPDLAHFRPYFYYLVMHFNNIAYEGFNEEISVRHSLDYNHRKLVLIDSMIKVDDIKNNLLRHTAMEFLLVDQDKQDNEQFLIQFFKSSTNTAYDHEINSLYHNVQNIQKGKKLPNVTLVNMDGDTLGINSIGAKGKSTVYYFWSMNHLKHMKSVTAKVKKLQKQYPEINFVGINIDYDHEKWKNNLTNRALLGQKQFRCSDFEKMSKKLVMPNLNKTIIVDQKGKIVNAFANLYEVSFEKSLAQLQ